MIQNPVLPGFNPDPSIIRVGDDYYIATSTFEWFPGVKLYHSKNLANWTQIGYALDRKSQIDLTGLDTARGVWAPCLSYNESENLFYLVFSNVYSHRTGYFDLDNFLVTSTTIDGPWSDPIYLNSGGFDASLFHDDDSRAWLVSLEWDNREAYPRPGWIILQEYSKEKRCLVGPITRLTQGGTRRGCIEAPHLYKRNGYYYLMTAEGGTGYGHAVVMLRSKNINGPYESDPNGAMLTSHTEEFDEFGSDESVKLHRYTPDLDLYKSGHGSLVHTQTDKPFIAHLCARPLPNMPSCILGRETAIQSCYWSDDNWLRLDSGDNLARLEQCLPEEFNLTQALPYNIGKDLFTGDSLNHDYQSYRLPLTPDVLEFTKPGIRLRGTGSLFSSRQMSLIARRIHHFNASFETEVEFEPPHHLASAGLVAFYSSDNFFYLRIYWSESLNSRCIGLLGSSLDGRSEHREFRCAIAKTGAIQLRVELNLDQLQFKYKEQNQDWKTVGGSFDASILSDEYGNQKFTGSFIGLFCDDLRNRQATATFSYLDYQCDS